MKLFQEGETSRGFCEKCSKIVQTFFVRCDMMIINKMQVMTCKTMDFTW